jgi:hypothetical protein
MLPKPDSAAPLAGSHLSNMAKLAATSSAAALRSRGCRARCCFRRAASSSASSPLNACAAGSCKTRAGKWIERYETRCVLGVPGRGKASPWTSVLVSLLLRNREILLLRRNNNSSGNPVAWAGA